MQRGDIVLCQFKSSYVSKARPCVIIQSNQVANTFESITLCPITSLEQKDTSAFRIAINPNKTNKLKKKSFVMIDKLGSFPTSCLKPVNAKLSPAILKRIDLALIGWLDLRP
ncbi:MAG: type II toxin-antitoxin system PemK/MazF family toxin [Coxiellaceae bacterium]|nr:type II toxin-antitoxin system PemK/MazF family toxin [Coxiellaceae bacterium]